MRIVIFSVNYVTQTSHFNDSKPLDLFEKFVIGYDTLGL